MASWAMDNRDLATCNPLRITTEMPINGEDKAILGDLESSDSAQIWKFYGWNIKHTFERRSPIFRGK